MDFKFYIFFLLSIFINLLLETGCAFGDISVVQPPPAESGLLIHRKLIIPNVVSASHGTVSMGILSADEKKLYDLIMAYRRENGLPQLPVSAALTETAQVHSQDLNINKPHQGECNMHSWSNKGNWTPCCYTRDHKAAACVTNKPMEIAGFKGNGYEISYGVSGATATPEGSLSAWKKSPGHNNMILNRSVWKDHPWKSIGIGIYKNYANVWFSKETS